MSWLEKIKGAVVELNFQLNFQLRSKLGISYVSAAARHNC